jgi:TolB-like protein/Tfp pilus assembly protein PilF
VAIFTWRRSNVGANPQGAGTASVAVLPFTDLSAGHDNDYLGDGIAETITSALGRVQGLQIAPRTSAFSFRGRNTDSRDVGAKLHVSAVLTGSVQRAGDQLRITAQLVKTSDGVSAWSDKFDGAATDIFALQDTVARAVIGALRGAVLSKSVRSTGTETGDPEAYDLYLQGRFFQNKRNTIDVRRSIGLFERAIARDSLYAQAWTGLADAYMMLAWYSNVPATATLTKSRHAIERALRLAPDFGDAQTTRAYLSFVLDWNWPAADSAFQRALALSPNYSVGHKWYGDVQHAMGRDAKALSEYERARELDPLAAGALNNLAQLARYRGDDSASLLLLEQALTLEPTLPPALAQLTSLMFDRGDSARFLAAQTTFVATSEIAGAPAEALRRAWQRGGRTAVMRAQIAALDSLQLPFQAAIWRMKAGDLDGMFRDLDRAYDVHSVWLTVAKFFIISPAATHDPRFKAFLARLKISDGKS